MTRKRKINLNNIYNIMVAELEFKEKKEYAIYQPEH